ncbi:hypothetical protein N658DRAFT_500707 [Parathielavia hyrcaniae]|uniref:Uncharacterized protein n=1 Tax=Parathielavia hyrcaniae TaxID=113614 RepID=A0AAN6PU99_9PEZI|nr:hypothetical protein N658DRAFT_500707 [Parathielavia hyrcaniae]
MTDDSPLLAIPVEIQLAICAQLLTIGSNPSNPDTHGSPREPAQRTWESTLDHFPALGSLALTCKHLQGVVTPLLYQSIRVSLNEPGVCIRLIRHFSQFPDDAELVRTLDICGGSGWPSLPSSQAAFLFQEVNRLGIQIGPCTESVHTISLLIDVLLCQVRDIKKLIIREPKIEAADDFPVVPLGLDYARRLPANFVLGSLQELETLSPPGQVPMSASHMASLAALVRRTPALTFLGAGRCNRRVQSIVHCSLPQLRSLHVLDISPEALEGLAKCSTRLERVTFLEDTFDLAPEVYLHPIDMEPERIEQGPVARALRSLLPLTSTLRHLKIRWHSFIAFNIQALDLVSRFDALQSLGLICRGTWPLGDPDILINKLPCGIQSLRIVARCPPIHDIARRLSGRIRQGQLPEFESFRYTYIWKNRFQQYNKESEMEEQVAVFFRGTGVDCVSRRARPLTGDQSGQ